jgi:hypothetical protein
MPFITIVEIIFDTEETKIVPLAVIIAKDGPLIWHMVVTVSVNAFNRGG